MRPIASLSALAAAALLAACSTVSFEPAPAMPLAESFGQAQGYAAGPAVQRDWWLALGDAPLAALIERGLDANLDLRLAAERVQRSRALHDGARADLRPSHRIVTGARATQASTHEAPGLDEDERRHHGVNVGSELSWEIDLFGRLRHTAAAAGKRVAASEADAQAMQLAVSAEVAQAWYALAGAREQLQIARSVIENRRATLQLVQRRTRAGLGAPIDEARARADLAAAEAEVPVHDAAATVATHRLAVLLGELPSTYAPPAAPSVTTAPVEIAVPSPAQWLAHRPDLRAAEARLQAQAFDVAAVRAEFLPRLTLNGALGFVAGSASALGGAGSLSWLVAPSLSMPLFDQSRIDARLAGARSQQREALIGYQQRVLLAVEEVENGLARVRQAQSQLTALQQRAHHAAVAERLARKRFEAGAADLLELLDAQRGAQQAEGGLSSALTAQRQQVVTLLKALGARSLPQAPAAA
jgi:multidrug efflux system outer membrane protein